AVLDLEIVHRGLELLRGNLERLLLRDLGGLHHGHADGVRGLAARAEASHRRHAGVAGRDLNLVDVAAVAGAADLAQPGVGPGEVDLAGHHLERAIGVEPHGGAGRLKSTEPAAEREARAAELSVLRTRLPLRALLPEWVLGEPRQHLDRAVAEPRLVVRHL